MTDRHKSGLPAWQTPYENDDAAPLRPDDYDFIELPAIAPRQSGKEAVEQRPAKIRQDAAPAFETPEPALTVTLSPAAPAAESAPDEPEEELLPELRSGTDGLRELLSSIGPPERGYHQGPYFDPSLTMLPDLEDNMHLPHSRHGLPGTPDLPVAPAGWGRPVVNLTLALFALFVGGLAYSLIVSPTGVDWARVKQQTGKAYDRVASTFDNQTQSHHDLPRANRPRTEAAASAAKPATPGANLQVTAAPRMQTTSAAAQLKAPSLAELMMSPQELESQVRALEGRIAVETPQRPSRGALGQDSSGRDLALMEPLEDDVVLPIGARIDPEMEKSIFARASGYLKQRDLTSARMILEYAASQGSGTSALALAETYDPAYLTRVNLDAADGNAREARRWYRAAYRLGVKEARQRLAGLPGLAK